MVAALPATVTAWGRVRAVRCGLDPEDGESLAAQAWAEHVAPWTLIANRRMIDESRKRHGRHDRRPPEVSLDQPLDDDGDTLTDLLGVEEPGYAAAEARVDLCAMLADLSDADVARLARHAWLGQPVGSNGPARVAYQRSMRHARAASLTNRTEPEAREMQGEASRSVKEEDGPPPQATTRARLAVLAAAAEGLRVKEIAARLVVSPNTVKTTLQLAARDLGGRNTTGTVATAIRRGLI